MSRRAFQVRIEERLVQYADAYARSFERSSGVSMSRNDVVQAALAAFLAPDAERYDLSANDDADGLSEDIDALASDLLDQIEMENANGEEEE